MKKIIILLSLILTISISNSFSQMQYSDFDCHFLSDTNVSTSNSFRGSVKPNRTDSSGNAIAPSESYFPVLVVFVQFKNEASDPRNSWPQNSAPAYLNNVIAKGKNTTGNWWNWYDPESEVFSSHWMEISRGVFHVISPVPDTLINGAFSVVLPYEASHYDSLGVPGGELKINEDIWKSISAQGLTDWRKFDRWKYDTTDSYFHFTDLGQGDGYVDMIYKIHKSRGSGGMVNYAGYNVLSWWSPETIYLVDTTNNIKINYGNNFIGSGITVAYRGQLAQYIGTAGHEHGHQLFCPWGHSTYSRVSFGFGFDDFYSPSDMILNGYMSPAIVTFNTTNYLGDYSSRNNGTGNLLKVPIQGDEYFLLASRNKYSKWDRVMIGDTAQIDPYVDNSSYGKGLYIYHIPNGLQYPGGDISQQDMECADGLFEWEYVGQSAQQVIHDCFVSGSNDWPYYKWKNVIYENDSSNLYPNSAPPNGSNRPIGDGISFRKYYGYVYPNYIYHVKWWGEGKQPLSSCDIGLDRVFTNYPDVYSRFDVGGDRGDPWKPGYNEVFSPYSSPNTNTWSNENSGIFIWYNSYSGSSPGEVASLKIYKAGTGGFSEDSILHLTPPSRPMGLKVEEFHPSGTYSCYPKLTWNHNMEPDMVRTGNLKKYQVYAAADSLMTLIPNNYVLASTLEIHSDSIPAYVDYSVHIFGCPYSQGTQGEKYPVRYYVKSVDKYDDTSVPSDFVQTVGETGAFLEEEPDNLNCTNINPDIPKEYYLDQNYPNPFNPVTKIRYDLPFDGKVSIRIYDINGRLILTLLNENKTAGRYETEFSGEDLSSGVYYYKIESGSFSRVRKMILIK